MFISVVQYIWTESGFLVTEMIQPMFLLALMPEVNQHSLIQKQDKIIPPLANMPFIPTLPDLPTQLLEILHFFPIPVDLPTPLREIPHFVPTPPEMATPLRGFGASLQHHRGI